MFTESAMRLYVATGYHGLTSQESHSATPSALWPPSTGLALMAFATRSDTSALVARRRDLMTKEQRRLDMRPKDRVLAAMNHQTTDRIPISLLSNYWLPETALALRRRYQLMGEGTRGLLFDIDTRGIEAAYIGPPLGTDTNKNPLSVWGTVEIRTHLRRSLSARWPAPRRWLR